MINNPWYTELKEKDSKIFQNHPKVSEPSEPHSEPPQKEYGCTVCKHSETCEPNIFGVCNKFERIEK